MAITGGIHTLGEAHNSPSFTSPGKNTQATGSLLVAVNVGQTVVGISDSNSNTWTLGASQNFNGTAGITHFWYVQNAVGGTGQTFTGTQTGGAGPQFLIGEFLGCALSGGPNASNFAELSGSVAAVTGPAVTPTVDGCLIVTVMVGDNFPALVTPASANGTVTDAFSTNGNGIAGAMSWFVAGAKNVPYSDTLTFSGQTAYDFSCYTFAFAPGSGTPAVAWRPQATILPGRGPGKTRFFRATRSFNTLQIGALVGDADLVFGQTGAITATGTLSGSSALVIGETGLVTGAGALTGTAALVIGETGAVTGAGSLSGTSALVFAETGALTGAGVLAGTSALVFGQTGSLTQGALAGTSALVFGQTGVMTGAGALAGTAALTFNQTGVLTGAGVLAGASALVINETGATTGAGALSGSSALAFGETGAATGAGVLSGTSALVFGQTGTLTPPAGALAGTAALSFDSSATLTGFGALIGACQILIDASATSSAAAIAGPVDSPRISDTAFRRKRKKLRLKPVFIAPASFEVAPPQEVIDLVPSFQFLADLTGKPLESLRADIDQEIELLMRELQERDDEEALLLILTALD